MLTKLLNKLSDLKAKARSKKKEIEDKELLDNSLGNEVEEYEEFDESNEHLLKDKKHKSRPKVFSLLDPENFVDTGDSTRVEYKTIQAVTRLNISLFIVSFMLIALIIALLPLKQKVPYFVHFMPKEEQITYIEPYRTSKSSQRARKEFLAIDYVKNRETLDLVTENERYTKIILMSTQSAKNEFLKQYHPDNNPQSPYKEAVDGSYVRSIKIIVSSVINNNVIQVDYSQVDSAKSTGKIIRESIRRATVTFVEDNTKYKDKDYLNNPFGYLISDYSIGIKEKNIQIQNQNILEGESNTNSQEFGKKVESKKEDKYGF